jgi:hypothetical protein
MTNLQGIGNLMHGIGLHNRFSGGAAVQGIVGKVAEEVQ